MNNIEARRFRGGGFVSESQEKLITAILIIKLNNK